MRSPMERVYMKKKRGLKSEPGACQHLEVCRKGALIGVFDEYIQCGR